MDGAPVNPPIAIGLRWMGHPAGILRGVLLGTGVRLFLRRGVAAGTGRGVLCYSLPEGKQARG